jgi:hypothetical protein
MPVAATDNVIAIAVWVLVAIVALAILAGIVGKLLIRRGLREPFVVRMINRASDRVVDSVKRPLTVAVLDEVASVLQVGHYTRKIKAMVAEKIKGDPTAGRINFVPFHDRIIEEASETTLRVILEVLADPRTDELVADMLRDNITQIKQAVRESID